MKKSYNPRTRDNNLKVNIVIEDFKSAFSDFCVYVDNENPKPEKLFSKSLWILKYDEIKENKKIEKKGKNQLDYKNQKVCETGKISPFAQNWTMAAL